MRVGVVVEIAPNHSGELPINLIDAAYRASRSSAIMIVLRPDLSRGVDRVLDPIVRSAGVDVKGLVYADLDDRATVLRAAREASLIVAATREFRSALSTEGIEWCDVETGMMRLAMIARGGAAPVPGIGPWEQRGQSFAAGIPA